MDYLKFEVGCNIILNVQDFRPLNMVSMTTENQLRGFHETSKSWTS